MRSFVGASYRSSSNRVSSVSQLSLSNRSLPDLLLHHQSFPRFAVIRLTQTLTLTTHNSEYQPLSISDLKTACLTVLLVTIGTCPKPSRPHLNPKFNELQYHLVSQPPGVIYNVHVPHWYSPSCLFSSTETLTQHLVTLCAAWLVLTCRGWLIPHDDREKVRLEGKEKDGRRLNFR